MNLDGLSFHALEDRMARTLLWSVLSSATESGLNGAMGAAANLRNARWLIATLTAGLADNVSSGSAISDLSDQRGAKANLWSATND